MLFRLGCNEQPRDDIKKYKWCLWPYQKVRERFPWEVIAELNVEGVMWVIRWRGNREKSLSRKCLFSAIRVQKFVAWSLKGNKTEVEGANTANCYPPWSFVVKSDLGKIITQRTLEMFMNNSKRTLYFLLTVDTTFIS